MLWPWLLFLELGIISACVNIRVPGRGAAFLGRVFHVSVINIMISTSQNIYLVITFCAALKSFQISKMYQTWDSENPTIDPTERGCVNINPCHVLGLKLKNLKAIDISELTWNWAVECVKLEGCIQKIQWIDPNSQFPRPPASCQSSD